VIDIEKFKSARFWMSIVSIGTFAYLSCTGMLDAKDALLIITMVVSYYYGQSNSNPSPPAKP